MAQPKTKAQRLNYRRADFGILKMDKSLETLLITALESTNNVGDRTFRAVGGAEIRCSHYKVGTGLYLQLSTYTPDQPTSTIDSDKLSTSSNIFEQDAPTGKHFVDGELFIYVKGNSTILCTSAGAREQHADAYFKKILEKADYDSEAANLELIKVSNASKMDMIAKSGVKEIIMDCTLYEASLMRINKKNKKINSIKHALYEQVQSVFADDSVLKNVNERENLNIKISLSFDGNEARLKENSKIDGFGDQGKKRLASAANMLLEESDDEGMHGFKILTNNNNLITASEIRVSDTKRIQTFGKSLLRNDAWTTLLGYYKQLKHDGILNE